MLAGIKFLCVTSFHYLNSNRSASDRAVRPLACEKQNFNHIFFQRIFSPSSLSLNGKIRAWKNTSHLFSYCLRTSEKYRITGQTLYSRNRSWWIFHFDNHSIFLCSPGQPSPNIVPFAPWRFWDFRQTWRNVKKYNCSEISRSIILLIVCFEKNANLYVLSPKKNLEGNDSLGK